MGKSMTEMFGEPISVYTRKQAIEDGVLVDLTEWASAEKGFIGGFVCPVACTAAVWSDINAIPESQSHQDVRGRAHDVLWMASLACRAPGDANPRHFRVILRVKGNRQKYQRYKIHSGPGDDGEHVITIMQPHED